MSKPTFDHRFLKTLKRRAKKRSREDLSARYTQWLDRLCAEYGFTYTALKRHVEALEHEARVAEEHASWTARLASPHVWGAPSETAGSPPRESLSLPFAAPGQIPWPDCFASSSLFNVDEGPRRMISSALSSVGPAMFFEGEELRQTHDCDVLMALFMVSGRERCGRLLTTSVAEIETFWGASSKEMDFVAERQDLEKSLWRLAHCTLKVTDRAFEGPLLAYVDASGLPERLAFRLHPDLANFFYSPIAAAILGG